MIKSCATLIAILMLLFKVHSLHASDDIALQEYQKFKNHERGFIDLAEGERIYYQITQREKSTEFEVITANISDKQPTKSNSSQIIVTLDHNRKTLQGFIETIDGNYQFEPGIEGSAAWKKIQPQPTQQRATDEAERIARSIHNTVSQTNTAESDNENEDSSSRYAVNVFIGFSDQAAADVGNIQTRALAYIEGVNTALRNSGINIVYLRLVGVGTSPHNPGVVTSVLTDGKQWFEDQIEELSPDLIGLVQRPTNVPGEARGWANASGDIHVISSQIPSAFQQSFGSNTDARPESP